MKRKQTELNPKQRRFVEEYLIDLNAKRAATVAGYSAKSAARVGCRLLRVPLVAEAVHKALEARSRRTHITADRVLREYARIAFADIRKFTTRQQGETGLKQLAELSDDDAAAVVELTGTPEGKGVKVKLHDKKRALDAIARHLGLFTKGQEPAESPSAAAERIRELIRARHARLTEPSGTE